MQPRPVSSQPLIFSEKPSQKPALSISAIDMLSKCGEQYRRRYIEHERIPPGVALLVGKGVDASVNANLKHKMGGAGLLPMDQVADLARDEFEKEWTAGDIKLNDAERAEGLPRVRSAAIDKTVRLARLHASDVAPILQPTAVQRRWQIELKNYPMDLVGYTDIEEGAAIRDTKTSAKSPRQEEAHLSDQLTLYALSRRALDKLEGPIPVKLDYLVDLKTPKAVVRESERTDQDFRVMLARLEVSMRNIEKGAFQPARQTEWYCSERWCGYAKTCPYFRGRTQFAHGEEI